MNATAASGPETIAVVTEFAIDVADDRQATYDTLHYRGRWVADVEARIVESQFRMPDGSTLLMLNDDKPFRELLTILLVGPSLNVVDSIRIGGAFTPGYLTTAYPIGPDQIAFCWHDLDQIVTVRRRRKRFGLRSRWLWVSQQPAHLQAGRRGLLPDVKALFKPAERRRRSILALASLTWLRLRTWRLPASRKRERAPKQ